MNMLKRVNLSHISALMILLFAAGWSIPANAYETKSNRQNRVRVDVRPVQLTAGQPAKFEVRMNTHSVALGHDMVAVTTLQDDQGREYRPFDWQGSPPGGHHRRGVLEFPALDGTPRHITLVIRDVADVPERIFKWSVEQ